jgi:Ran GTPase-activating protein (RanGAP) involved in mRNA processing and transport
MNVPTLTMSQIKMFFQARCLDLGIDQMESQFEKFKDHFDKYCINRKLNLSDMNFSIEGVKVITYLLDSKLDISHLIVNKNQIGDKGIKLLADCIAKNNTVIHLDVS